MKYVYNYVAIYTVYMIYMVRYISIYIYKYIDIARSYGNCLQLNIFKTSSMKFLMSSTCVL